MLIKAIFDNFKKYFVGESLTKLVSWLFNICMGVFLPVEQYGSFVVLLTVEKILVPVIGFGQNGTIQRFFYTFNGDQRKVFLYNNFLILLILSISTIIFLSYVFYKWFCNLLNVRFFPYIMIVLIMVFPLMLKNYHLVILQMEKKTHKFIKYSISFELIRLMFFFITLSISKDVVNYFIATLLSATIVNIPMLLDFKKKILHEVKFSFINESLLYGLPLIFHSLGGMLLIYSDRFLITHYLGNYYTGIYSFSYTVLMILPFVFNVINLAFYPYLYDKKLFPKNKIDEVFLPYGIILSIITIFALGFTIVLSTYFLPILKSGKYSSSVVYIKILSLVYFIQPFYLMCINKLNILKKTHYIGIITLVAAILNILLNLILIPKYELSGALVSTVFCYFLQILLMWLLAFGIKLIIPLKIFLLQIVIMGILVKYNTNKYQMIIVSLLIFYILIKLSFNIISGKFESFVSNAGEKTNYENNVL
ncbi:MAG: hypothetical protein Kow0037_14560 [Calditrichia bacterium]